MRSGVLVAALLLAGCAARRAPPTAPASAAPTLEELRALACGAPEDPVRVGFSEVPSSAPPDGARVAAVVVRGARRVPASSLDAEVQSVMQTKVGDALDSARLDADLVRIHGLGLHEDVRIRWDRGPAGLTLIVEVDERPSLRHVFLSPGSPDPELGSWQPLLSGDLYDPAAVARALSALRRSFASRGHADVEVRARARRVDAEQVDICLDLRPGPRWMVERVTRPGATLSKAELGIGEVESNAPGEPFRPDLLLDYTRRLDALYFVLGFRDVTSHGPRITRVPERSAVILELPITEGTRYRLGSITIAGKLGGERWPYAVILREAKGAVASKARVDELVLRLRRWHRKQTGRDVVIEPSLKPRPKTSTLDVELRVKEP